MAKVTSKLQVTVPKALADRFGIVPGDQIDWEPAGDVIRVVPGRKRPRRDARARARARLFDQATKRQRERQAATPATPASQRGWTREDLYDRGRAR
jgi:AbrB family looped-hinge helix DNA binding protein